MEQLANLSARNAVRQYRKQPEESRNPAKAVVVIQDLLSKLDWLTKAVGPTPERLSLQAGCWKRLAQVDPRGEAANEALKSMKACCDEAVGLGGDDPDYPRFMACNAAICVALRDGTACDPSVVTDLQRMIEQPAPDEADFWTLIRSADARTNISIMNAAPPEDTNKIKDAYGRASRHIGSPVKMRSVTEQLEFYEDIFEGGADETASTRERVQSVGRRAQKLHRERIPGQMIFWPR